MSATTTRRARGRHRSRSTAEGRDRGGECDGRATPVAAAAVEEPPQAEPLDGSMEELLGDVATPRAPRLPAVRAVRRSRRQLSPALSVPAEPVPPSVADTSMPDADLPHADAAERSRRERSALAAGERRRRSTSASLRHPRWTRRWSSPPRSDANLEAQPARSAPPEPIPGILLADALGASSRPDDSSERAARSTRGSTSRSRSRRRRSRVAPRRSPRSRSSSSRRASRTHPTIGLCVASSPRRCSRRAIATGGIRELERAMTGAERAGELDLASSLAEEIARLEPEVVRHHQKRVEYAFRTNDRGRLIEAYLALADALLRSDQADKARAIYQRVLDLAPDDTARPAALETRSPSTSRTPRAVHRRSRPPPCAGAAPFRVPRRRAERRSARPPATSSSTSATGCATTTVPKDTRMVVAEQEPTGDEEADFADMLRKFKQGIAENVDAEDYQSHYDLAIAFKEMGLARRGDRGIPEGARQSDESPADLRGARPVLHREGAVQAGVVDSEPRAERDGAARTSWSACSICSGAAAEAQGKRGRGAGLLSTRVRRRHSVPRHRRANERSRAGAAMSGVVARTRTPRTGALRDIQAPVRERLERRRRRDAAHRHRRPADHPRGERTSAADARQDVSPHARAARERASTDRPEPRAITLGGGRRADAPRDARARRLGRPLGAATRAADGELAVQPSGVA